MEILGVIDWVVVALYFVVIGGISIWTIRKKKDSPTDYFLANRNLGWFVIGASILASNVGSEHIVGLAGTGAKSGLVMGHYELHSWIVLMLGWVFVPFYMRSRVFTMPEFLERRYNVKARWLLSIIQLPQLRHCKGIGDDLCGRCRVQFIPGVDFLDRGSSPDRHHRTLYDLRRAARCDVHRSIAGNRPSGRVNHSYDIGPYRTRRLEQPRRCCDERPPQYVSPAQQPGFPLAGNSVCLSDCRHMVWCTDQHIVQRCLAAGTSSRPGGERFSPHT